MKGKLLRDLGDTTGGDAQLDRALNLRRENVRGDERTWDQLSNADFDEVVYYYSR